jgi:flavin-dependent dehydrogenase
LRAHAPSLSVELVETSDYSASRVGETLPALARPVLAHLGVWDAFVAQQHRPSYGTVSVWGSAVPYANDFVFNAAGAGWHLDRARFDRMLFDAAGGTHRSSDAPARFTVDATGSAASIARSRGAQPIAVDRLVSFGRFFDDGDHDPRTIVESCEEGWWYTAGLPDGRRFAAFMTDADLARSRPLSDPDEWSRAASSLPFLAPLLKHANGPITARSAESRKLDVVAGDDWLAIGDAASRFDPLSSQGILKALRSGTFAAYAIGDLLARNDARGIDRYRAFIEQEFASYLAARARFYAEEQRWAASEFWRRRQLTASRSA